VRVVVLLAVAAFINYVDRGNLATAGPLIRDELALSNAQLGVLLSAFFWSYAPAQLLAGGSPRGEMRALSSPPASPFGVERPY